MSVNGFIENGELNISSPNIKEEKDSQKLLSLIKSEKNKKLKLLLLPYDLSCENNQN